MEHEPTEANWRRESRIAEGALRLTGVLGGALLGTLACALTDSANSRPLWLTLGVVGAGLGFWLSLQISLRLPPQAGGRGLNALSATWQGALFLCVGALALVMFLLVIPAYPLTFRSPWLKLWVAVTAGLAGMLGFAALVFRLDYRWFGMFTMPPDRSRSLALSIFVVAVLFLLLPPPTNLVPPLIWAKSMGEREAEDVSLVEPKRYGKLVFAIEVALAVALVLTYVGLKKMGLR